MKRVSRLNEAEIFNFKRQPISNDLSRLRFYYVFSDLQVPRTSFTPFFFLSSFFTWSIITYYFN